DGEHDRQDHGAQRDGGGQVDGDGVGGGGGWAREPAATAAGGAGGGGGQRWRQRVDQGRGAVADGHARRAAGDADDERLAHDLADDAAAAPAHRLEGAELPDPPGDRGHREDAGQAERRGEHGDRQPLAQAVGQGGSAGQRPG